MNNRRSMLLAPVFVAVLAVTVGLTYAQGSPAAKPAAKPLAASPAATPAAKPPAATPEVGAVEKISTPAGEKVSTPQVGKAAGGAQTDGGAQAGDGTGQQPADGEGGTAAPGPRPGLRDLLSWRSLKQNSFFLVLIGGFILMLYMSSRSKRKHEAKRRDMLAGLSKGDKVTSIGGIVGTIVDVREDEVVVKVDENNNIRMRFARWAIRGVGDTAKTESVDQRR